MFEIVLVGSMGCCLEAFVVFEKCFQRVITGTDWAFIPVPAATGGSDAKCHFKVHQHFSVDQHTNLLVCDCCWVVVVHRVICKIQKMPKALWKEVLGRHGD